MTSYVSPIADLPFEQNGHLFTDSPTMQVLRTDGEPPLFLEGHRDCYFCGARPLLSVVDETVVQGGEPCTASGGVTTRVTLKVPSGRIVVTDSLQDVYDVDFDQFASYNTAFGQAQVVEAMADLGCAYGPVGNSCPGLYRTGPDSYVIANPGYDEEYEPLPLPDGWVRLAGITTDLWAYSIADFEDWVSKGGEPSPNGWSESVVDVPAGVYRFTHHTGERDFDRDSRDLVVFAHIERIG